jgi:hypothetical protein
VRADAIRPNISNNVDKAVDKAERLHEEGKNAAARAQLRAAIKQLRGPRYASLRGALADLAYLF